MRSCQILGMESEQVNALAELERQQVRSKQRPVGTQSRAEAQVPADSTQEVI